MKIEDGGLRIEEGAREDVRPPAGAERRAAFAFYRLLQGITGYDSLLQGNFFRLKLRQVQRLLKFGYSHLFTAINAY
jgi:hypothetical protein